MCFISAYTAKELIAKGEVMPILADFPSADVYSTYALYLSHRHQSAVVKAFVGFLKEQKSTAQVSLGGAAQVMSSLTA